MVVRQGFPDVATSLIESVFTAAAKGLHLSVDAHNDGDRLMVFTHRNRHSSDPWIFTAFAAAKKGKGGKGGKGGGAGGAMGGMMGEEEEDDEPVGGPGGAQYGGLMSQGYVPPGQFEDLLNLIRQASAAAERAMNAAKYSEMAASSAGVAGQQAVVRAMHMANAPGGPAASPFSPGTPGPATGLGTACGPDPSFLALVSPAPFDLRDRGKTPVQKKTNDTCESVRTSRMWDFLHPRLAC